MQAVLLAGGYGTRISEETHLRPKPMIEIGGRPILWHIMKSYAHHGITDFIICCGYKGYVIKEYFSNYFLHNSDVTFDLSNNSFDIHGKQVEPWRVTLVDTGEATATGGRLLRIRDYLKGTFCLTYGDGVSDVDITSLVDFHRQAGRLATITTVQPPGRFGALRIDGDRVASFQEKPKGDGAWINGGFFVFEPEFLDAIESEAEMLEEQPLQTIAENGQLSVWKHDGFWAAMDSLRDKNHLEKIWAEGQPPWKVWS